jgi:beta-barrel assembly-enhancing protease
MKRLNRFALIIGIPVLLLIASCGKDDSGVNIFTTDDDIQLGLQMQQQILGDPANYPILDSIQYAEAYQNIQRIRDTILATHEVDYDKLFEWDVHIIQNDTVLNAFCTPGGYIYFYSGLIKFLDSEAQFAGVLGHEMAHAARRHSTNQMTKAYGLEFLFSVVLGQNPNALVQMAADLAAGVSELAFSREDEYEADEYSVKYLYLTSYDPRGVAGFFQKLGESPQLPEFLSTHPNPQNRIDKIDEVWQSLGGKSGQSYEARYQQFKNSLP